MRYFVIENEEFAEKASPSLSMSSLSSTNVDPISSEIVDLVKSIDGKLRKREIFFSLEVFPSNKCDKETYERFLLEVNGSRLTPLFYALTWHEHFTTDANPKYLPLEIVKYFPNNTLLHVAANNLKKVEVDKILQDALAQGKTNIFALRGDSCTGTGDFAHAVDLVKFIRRRYKNKFTICVAAYPHMHPESISKKMDIVHLTEKVNAGANFIITQICFDSEVFANFVNECRNAGITVPIIAGIFPIQNFKSLMRMAKLCSLVIPQVVLRDIELIKNNDDRVYDYGIVMAARLIKEIMATETASGFHLFTLNRGSILLDICRKMFD